MMASGTGVALEKERLTTRIAALKASVMKHDESIAALTSSAATSESGMPSHARATVDLLALLKVQLAELHEVLLDKERSIQELRLKARFTRVGEVALQTKALIEEAKRLQLLVAETKARLAKEQHSSRHHRIESLRSQSAAMAAAQTETIARNTEARARKQQAWELLSAFAAKLDGVSGPLSRAAEALAREHEARAAAQARLSGNEKAKAVWIGILASEVGVANKQADEAVAARDMEAAARMSSLRELEARVSQRRTSASEEELALRKSTAEVREVAAATHLAERRIRSLERGAAATGGSCVKDGAATRAGGATRTDGAGMAGGAAAGDANATASAVPGARGAAGAPAANTKPPDRATPKPGERRESPATRPATSAGGGGSEGAEGGKSRASEFSRPLGRDAPPDGAEPTKAVSGSVAELAAAKQPRTVGGTPAPVGVATGVNTSSVVLSGDWPPPRAPADSSSMSELQRYQLLMKKWKHRLDTDALKEAGNEAGNEADREAADPSAIGGSGDNGARRAQAREQL